MSYQRLRELEHQWRAEVDEWLVLGEQAEQVSRPDGLILAYEMARRQERLATLAPAQAMWEARAQERYQAERTEYEATLRAREAKRARVNRGGLSPNHPNPGHVPGISTTSPIPSRAS